MSAADRLVVGAIAFMYAAIPLYGAFGALDPLHPPIPLLTGVHGAATIGVAMLVAAAICVWGAVRRPVPRRLAFAQLAAGTAIVPAALLGFDPRTGLLLALIVLAQGCVAIAVYGYAPLPGAIPAIVGSTLASGAVASALALALVLTRWPPGLYAYNNGRAVGTFLNANELAAYLLVVLALAAGVVAFGRGRSLRILAACTLAVGLAAFAASYSRWGLLAAAAGLAAFALAAGGRRPWGVLALACVAAAVIVLGPGAAHHNPRDDTARFAAWTTGVRTFLAFPLTGVGPFAFARTYEVLRPPDAPGGAVPVAYDPHSLPLAFLAESGLVGGLALIFGWSVYVREIRRHLRRRVRRDRALALAAAAGMIALNVHVLVNTISIYFPLAAQGAALTLAFAQWGSDAREG